MEENKSYQSKEDTSKKTTTVIIQGIGSKENSEEGLVSPNVNNEDINNEDEINRQKMNQENIKNYFPKLDMLSHKIPFNYPSRTGQGSPRHPDVLGKNKDILGLMEQSKNCDSPNNIEGMTGVDL